MRRKSDPNLYIKFDAKGKVILISLYVDDLIIIGNSDKQINGIKTHMVQVFEMKDLDELNYCLVLEFWRDVSQTFVSQGKYVRELLKKFKIDQCKDLFVPMKQNMKLYSDDGSKEVDDTIYIQLVGSLNYLNTTRTDITYLVSVLSQFMVMPLEIHWKTVKGVLRYLKGTIDFGIKYDNSFDVELT